MVKRTKNRDHRRRIQEAHGASLHRRQNMRPSLRLAARHRISHTRNVQDSRLLRREFKRIPAKRIPATKLVTTRAVNQPDFRTRLYYGQCRVRKGYKKQMLKALAAQAVRSGKLSSWRRKRAMNRQLVRQC